MKNKIIKRNYYLVLCLLLLFTLSGCRKDERKVLEDSTLEKSKWQELSPLKNISITLLEPVTTKSKVISLQITNSSDIEHYLHEDVHVDKQLNGVWYSYVWPYNTEEFSIILNKDDYKWEAPLDETKLSLGTYRVIWEVTSTEEGNILAFTEFEVKE